MYLKKYFKTDEIIQVQFYSANVYKPYCVLITGSGLGHSGTKYNTAFKKTILVVKDNGE